MMTDIHVGKAQTVFGVMWYVIDSAGERHWFGTKALAVAWAARHRYNTMIGDVE